MRGGITLRLGARRYGRLLHRFLHRFVKMPVGDLKIVLRCDCPCVSYPCTDDMRWKGLFELRLPCTPQVLEEFRPRLQPGAPDDPQQLSSQIDVRAPVTGDDVERCPWVLDKIEGKGHLCGIDSIKPDHCRAYPEHQKHAESTGCRGYDKPVVSKSVESEEEQTD